MKTCEARFAQVLLLPSERSFPNKIPRQECLRSQNGAPSISDFGSLCIASTEDSEIPAVRPELSQCSGEPF
jgi:hypothetical protein